MVGLPPSVPSLFQFILFPYLGDNERPCAYYNIMEFKNIYNKKSLAEFLGINYSYLTYILYAKGPDNLYVSFDIPKKSGEMRHINAPIQPLKHVQKRLSKELYKAQEKYYLKGSENGVTHGFVKHRSFISNAKNHRHKKYILNIDLENFFDSFHFGRVKGYFEKNNNFKCPSEVAICIAQLTCYQGKLPQGAPTSPVITNLICAIMDYRILEISSKYKLYYTRYADDLTFSTNDPHFYSNKEHFLNEIDAVIQKSGFKINYKKVSFSSNTERQEVTGVVVNDCLNTKREYNKITRSMVDHLYKGLNVECNGKSLTINQLEGRLSYINQLDWYNNKYSSKKRSFWYLNSREKQYRNFLFYKYFFANPKPIIVTEGKTDIIYIKAALRKMHSKYPELIKCKEKNSFEYNISFLNKTKRLSYLLNISEDGADTMKNIFNYYKGRNSFPDLYSKIKEQSKQVPKMPVILIFDNEQVKNKPLKIFLKYIGQQELLKENLFARITDNLYVVTNPLVNGEPECEIEDLFPKETLSHVIGGKTFNRKSTDDSIYYGKAIFASYISSDYLNIDFSLFEPLLDSINAVIHDYKNKNDD